MEKILNEMSAVSSCDVSQCSYNANNKCHAKAITIGDGVNPGCDTFLGAGEHITKTDRIAGVGACKVSACVHNEDFECAAESISIGFNSGEVKCMTFELRHSDEIQEDILS